MSTLVRFVRALAWSWFFAAWVLILVGYASTWYRGGFGALRELLGSHILTNFIAVSLTLAPAFFLYKLARGIQEKHRGKILRSAVALVVNIAALSVITLLPLALERDNTNKTAENGKAREYEAQSIRVKDQSATMYQYQDHAMTTLSDPAGNAGIPEMIRIGDAITVDGHTIRVKHILVKEIVSDINYDGQVFGKAGDAQCVVMESPENLPYEDESAARERLWITVENCAPIDVTSP